jgi:hypothetical protein
MSDRERFWSDEEVDRAVKSAVREALLSHGRRGDLVAVERQGQVLLVRVEDAVVVSNQEESEC